jgi:hypothetical protein
VSRVDPSERSRDFPLRADFATPAPNFFLKPRLQRHQWSAPLPSLYNDDRRAFWSINIILSSSFRLRRSTSHTKGDQSSSAFSSCSLFALAGCRLGIDLQSSRRIQCCARYSNGSCSGCRSDGRNRRMSRTRGRNPSIRGLRRLRMVGEAMSKSVRVCCVASAALVAIWQDDIESARVWKYEFFLPMKHVGNG